MSEEENVQELIQTPHGVQESIKMDLLEWIQEARDPYEIIYGEALREPKPLADEIKALSARKERIQNYLTATAKDDTVSEEERARLNFSVKAHERKIQQLEKQI